MAVVVFDDEEAVGVDDGEAVVEPLEVGETALHGLEGDAEMVADGDGADGVSNIVAAGEWEAYLAQLLAASEDLEAERQLSLIEEDGAILCIALDGVGGDRLGDPLEHLPVAVAVDVHKGAAQTSVGLDDAGHRDDDIEMVFVVVEVVSLDVVTEEQVGRDVGMGAIGLVHLGNDDVALPCSRVEVVVEEQTADDEAGLTSCGVEHLGDHGADGALSVGACHADAQPLREERCEEFGAMKDRETPLARSEKFRVVGGDGGREDDDLGALDVFGALADGDAGAERGHRLSECRLPDIGAGDRISALDGDPCDGRNADAADAEKVKFGTRLEHHRGGLDR